MIEILWFQLLNPAAGVTVGGRPHIELVKGCPGNVPLLTTGSIWTRCLLCRTTAIQHPSSQKGDLCIPLDDKQQK